MADGTAPAGASAARVVCPQCGGDNQPSSGERFLDCAFCGASLFVDRSGVVDAYRLPRLLSAEEARSALRRWMAGNDTVKDLDRKSAVDRLEETWFPMWMFRTQEAGGQMVYVEPAAPTPIPELADLKVPAGRLEPYRAGPDDPDGGATIPMETARGWLEQRGVGRITETALVQVPLWRAGYSFGGESFQAVIEGSTGRVLASVYPEKAESPYLLIAILGLVLFAIEGLVISNPLTKAAVYLLTAMPLLLLAWWVTRKV